MLASVPQHLAMGRGISSRVPADAEKNGSLYRDGMVHGRLGHPLRYIRRYFSARYCVRRYTCRRLSAQAQPRPAHPPAFIGAGPTRLVHLPPFLGTASAQAQPGRYTRRHSSAPQKPQPIPALSYAPMNDGMRPAAVASAISRSAWATDSSSAGPMCQRAHSLTAGTAFATATECG